MGIDANIVNFGQSTPTANALSQFGGQLAGAIQANKQAGIADNRRQAAALLGQAFSDESDDATTTQLIQQARELDPEFVLATMQQVGAGQSKSSIDQQKIDMRKLELEGRALERLLKEETNELKRTEIKNKLLIQEEKLSELKGEADTKSKLKTSAEEQLLTTAALAKELASSDILDQIVGTVGIDLFPTVRGESQDLINKAKRLNSLLTVDNLDKMSGILTDKDIELLKDIASGLNVTDKGIKGSVEGVKKRLNEIVLKLEEKSAPADSGKSESAEVIQWSDL